MSRPFFLLLPLALLACTAEAPAPPPSADSLPAPSNAPDTVADPVARWRARLPDMLLVRRGACPFECCRYGTWTAESRIPLREIARRAAPVRYTLMPEQRFQADSGTVYVTGIALVAVRDTVTAWLGNGPHRFAAGDTLLLLDALGEGSFNVWYRGGVEAAEGFWASPWDTLRTTRIGRYQREWWVHATTPEASGWFLSDSVELRGADACAGPEE